MITSVTSKMKISNFSLPVAKGDVRDRSNTESTTTTVRSDSVSSIPVASYTRLSLPPLNITKKKDETPPVLRPDIKILCMECEEEISVRKMQEHRDWHSALRTFRYTVDNKPSNVKKLVGRRRTLTKKLNENADSRNPVSIKALHKINLAYEIIKADIEGTKSTLRQVDEIFQPDIRGTSVQLTCALSIGVCKDQNSRWRLSMEDRCSFKDCFCNDPQSGYFAVFDGYSGSVAAEKCAAKFHEILEKKVEKIYHVEIKHGAVNSEIVSAFREAYYEMDEVLRFGEDEFSRNRWSGCSAITCLLRGKNLFVANAGNIRAVLCRGDGSIVRVSHDQSPRNRKERHRVKRANGQVCQGDRSVYVNGVVTSTRGLGNHGDPRLKLSVINQPAVNCVALEDSDQFLLLASNGVWEVFNEEEMMLLLEEIIPDIDLKTVVQKMRVQMSLETGIDNENETLETTGETLLHNSSENSAEESNREANSNSYNEPAFASLNKEMNYNDCKNSVGLKSDINTLNLFHSDNEAEFDNSLAESTRQKGLVLSKEEKAVKLAKALSERLVEAALLAGSRDNSTVMVVLLKGCPVQMFLLPSASNSLNTIATT